MLLISLILFPLLGALLLAFLPKPDRGPAGHLAMAWSLLTMFLIIGLGGNVPPHEEWSLPWMPGAGMELRFVVDGISLLFLFLTGLLTLFSIVVSVRTGKGDRAYFALILVLEAALFGVFTARHFIPWFLCWEMTLVPAYLLIRLWGGAKAPRAALRFFIITLGGSAFMLVGFLALQVSSRNNGFRRARETCRK